MNFTENVDKKFLKDIVLIFFKKKYDFNNLEILELKIFKKIISTNGTFINYFNCLLL